MECRQLVDEVKADVSKDEAARVAALKMGDPGGCKECEDLQTEFAKNPGGRPVARAGLIVAGVVGGLGLAVTALCVPFVTPALRRVCLPYVPATTTQVGKAGEETGKYLWSWVSGHKSMGIILEEGLSVKIWDLQMHSPKMLILLFKTN